MVRFFKCLFMMAEIDKFTAQLEQHLEQHLVVKRMDWALFPLRRLLSFINDDFWVGKRTNLAIHPLRKLLEGIIYSVNVI